MPGIINDNVRNVMGGSAAIGNFDTARHPAGGLSVYVYLTPQRAYYPIDGGAGVGFTPLMLPVLDEDGGIILTLPANSELKPIGSQYRMEILRHGTSLMTTDPFVVHEGAVSTIGELIVATQTPGGGSDVAGLYKTFSNENYQAEPADRTIVQTGTMTATRTVTLPAAASVQAGWPVTVADASGTALLPSTPISVAAFAGDTISGGIFGAAVVLTYPNESVTFIADGSGNWTCDKFPLSADGTLASNSDSKVPTEKAVRTAIALYGGGTGEGGSGLELITDDGIDGEVVGNQFRISATSRRVTTRVQATLSSFTSTAFVNAITLPLEVNTRYDLEYLLGVNFPAAADLKYEFTLPAGATFWCTDSVTGGWYSATGATVATTGAAQALEIAAGILTSTAGDLILRLAKATATGVDGQLLVNSVAEAVRAA